MRYGRLFVDKSLFRMRSLHWLLSFTIYSILCISGTQGEEMTNREWVKNGTSVTLYCPGYSSAPSKPIFQWYKETYSLNDEPETGAIASYSAVAGIINLKADLGARGVTLSIKDGSLTFLSVELSDRGDYTCVAGRTGIRTGLTLKIYAPPQLFVISASPTGEVAVNATLNATCSATRFSPALLDFFWVLGGTRLEDQPEPKYTSISAVDKVNSASTLLRLKVTERHHGQSLSCRLQMANRKVHETIYKISVAGMPTDDVELMPPIIAGALGAVVLVLAIIGLACCILRRRRQAKNGPGLPHDRKATSWHYETGPPPDYSTTTTGTTVAPTPAPAPPEKIYDITVRETDTSNGSASRNIVVELSRKLSPQNPNAVQEYAQVKKDPRNKHAQPSTYSLVDRHDSTADPPPVPPFSPGENPYQEIGAERNSNKGKPTPKDRASVKDRRLGSSSDVAAKDPSAPRAGRRGNDSPTPAARLNAAATMYENATPKRGASQGPSQVAPSQVTPSQVAPLTGSQGALYEEISQPARAARQSNVYAEVGDAANNNKGPKAKGFWQAMADKAKEDLQLTPEVNYADLSIANATPGPPKPPRSFHGSPTEYAELDYKKSGAPKSNYDKTLYDNAESHYYNA